MRMPLPCLALQSQGSPSPRTLHPWVTARHGLQELWRLKLTHSGRLLFEVATEYNEEAQHYVEMIRIWVSAGQHLHCSTLLQQVHYQWR